MKKKSALTLSLMIALVAGYNLIERPSSTHTRALASAPENYEALSACDKQDLLWNAVETSVHDQLPPYGKFGLIQLLKMSFQELQVKGRLHSDFAPAGWRKFLHRRGAVAKVRLIPRTNPYTGIFQGAECGLLRLSLTYRPSGSRPVAPGLALKVLRDGTHSANVSALVSLDGQGKNFNFFKHPMSNIVPASDGFGAKLVHRLFRKVSGYPEELVVEHFGLVGVDGKEVNSPRFPRQLFFVPAPELKFPEAEHDVRENFMQIAPQTVVYRIYAVAGAHAGLDYLQYSPDKADAYLKESVHIADIETTSRFVASEFGDENIFFRHQLRP